MTNDELLIRLNEAYDKIKELEKEILSLKNENIEYKKNLESAGEKYYNIGYTDAIRSFSGELMKEISAAIDSNKRAMYNRSGEPKDDHSEEFFSWCNGKVSALRGIEDFIEEKLKECPESKINSTAEDIVRFFEKELLPFQSTGYIHIAMHEIKTIIKKLKTYYGVN
jgi:hypothetical protein